VTATQTERLTAVPSTPEHPATAEAQIPRLYSFVEALPGFPDEREFALAPIDRDGVLYSLRSLSNPHLRFVVMPPAMFFPNYHPAVDETDLAPLGAIDDLELQLLVIITVQDGIADATANLLAPIVLAPAHATAMQLVLADSQLPLRAPLVAAAS
jgi:flagellar assembly factor FliW